MLPTHVGMILNPRTARHGAPNAPHTRGDDPNDETGGLPRIICSPHTWG